MMLAGIGSWETLKGANPASTGGGVCARRAAPGEDAGNDAPGRTLGTMLRTAAAQAHWAPAARRGATKERGGAVPGPGGNGGKAGRAGPAGRG